MSTTQYTARPIPSEARRVFTYSADSPQSIAVRYSENEARERRERQQFNRKQRGGE